MKQKNELLPIPDNHVGVQQIEEKISKFYNDCEPKKPAIAAFYTDFAASRGSGNLIKQVIGRLEKAKEPIHLLFTGHVGCGKSSELLALERQLDGVPTGTARKKFFVVQLSTLEYFNAYDLSTIDMILAIVAEFASVLKTKANIELKDSYFTSKLRDSCFFQKRSRGCRYGTDIRNPKAEVKASTCRRRD